ncbi:dihydrolipoyllysine-residue succinyltransferase [Chytriomyces confervae]|uniref:dihydrolipoyllysine-residue succinyltransferase n=1 Tax=Chytriomyces confervae TaxID=246404 RepID=A0A507FNT8_9FUNG|nr:2-oxoglutarate dehydrogenase complex E2 component [Chytriomyces hyalinus]TPX77350.1 dihydrolipoyllysine-residue succinyltransferase [Chytriomyces confervae]
MLKQLLSTGRIGFVQSAARRTTAGAGARVAAMQMRFLTEKLVKTPPMADSITEGTLTKWHKAVGEFVARDEPIATIETDKVDVTVNSAESGTVLEYFAKEGDTVMVGSNLFKVDVDGVAGAAASKPASAPTPTPTPAAAAPAAPAATGEVKEVIVKTPPMADSITEGTLTKWHKSVGEYVARDEPIATIETDKVDVTVNSAESGIILEAFAKEGETVSVGSNLFKVNVNGSPSGASASAPAAAPTPKAAAPKAATPAPASAPKPAAAAAPAPAAKTAAANVPAQVGNRVERRVKMTRMRKTISSRLKESQNTAASLTTFNEIDMSNLIEFRSKYKDAVMDKHGVKMGFMGAFIKASAQAMKDVPEINARIEGDEIVYSDFVDISVAVATPKGLVTPVVRNCENMSILDCEKEISALGAKAKANGITIEDLAGGTFTISNGGVFGSLYGTPIINQPQSAILGMHATKDRAVVVNGQVVVRPMMYVALTYDHRLIDGREAVTFLVRVKELIEDPRRLLLEI